MIDASSLSNGRPQERKSPETLGGTLRGEESKTVAEMLDVHGVAEMLQCSTRHVVRLADRGAMPQPLKLGRIIRWRRADVLKWIDAGCPSCRSMAKRSRQ